MRKTTLSRSSSAPPKSTADCVKPGIPDHPSAVPTLTTERLTLRPIHEGDAPSLAAIVQLPEVVAALGHDQARSDDQVLDWIRNLRPWAAAGLRYAFAITLSATSRVVGVIELNPINAVSREADLTLWLARDARKQRLGTEAARAVIDWATNSLHLDVNGVTDPNNRAAIALMRALGMDDDGIHALNSRRRGSVPAHVFKVRYTR